jgi:hypothetical protein
MVTSNITQAESVRYVAEVLGSDRELSWITDAARRVDDVTGAEAFPSTIDVYAGVEASSVTWMWSVAPVTADQLFGTTDGLRALRHPDGWLVLIDADDPAFIWVEPDADVYRSGSRTVIVDGGSIPRPGVVGRLSEEPFDVESGLTPSRISAALGLWIEALLGAEVRMAASPIDESQRAAIARLASSVDPGEEPAGARVVGEEALGGILADADDIVGARQSVWWVQTELTWPDESGEPCFPGSIQIHVRESDGALAWLAEMVPLEGAVDDLDRPELATIDCDGWTIAVPVDDPYVIHVPFDRQLFTVGRASDAYEALGIGVVLGVPPTADVWDRLRVAVNDLEGGVVHRAPGWSEERVSESLAAWLAAGSDRTVEFWYDPDDPVSRQGEIANRDRADAEPRTAATGRRCMFVRPDSLEHEVGARCANPQQFHYRMGEDVVFVCDRHVPDGVAVTPVMQR